MTKKEMQEMFERNFDREAYEKAKTEVLNYVRLTDDDYDMLYKSLNGYDINYWEDDADTPDVSCIDFYCEKELDRSHMATDADYVSVEFTVAWSRKRKAWIESARLYVSFPDGNGGILCAFDPDTCEMTERLY